MSTTHSAVSTQLPHTAVAQPPGIAAQTHAHSAGARFVSVFTAACAHSIVAPTVPPRPQKRSITAQGGSPKRSCVASPSHQHAQIAYKSFMAMIQNRAPRDQIQMVLHVIKNMREPELSQYMALLQDLRSRSSIAIPSTADMYKNLIARATSLPKCKAMRQQFDDLVLKMVPRIDSVFHCTVATSERAEFLTRYATLRQARTMLEDRYIELLSAQQLSATHCSHGATPPGGAAAAHTCNNGSTFLAFTNALRYARAIKIKNQTDWEQWSKTGALPSYIPSNPAKVYEHHGWQGWVHWLGTSKVGLAGDGGTKICPEPMTPITFADVDRCGVCQSSGLCASTACDWARIGALVKRSIPGATVSRLERVTAQHQEKQYVDHRENEVKPTSANNRANEQICFHGTGQTHPKDLLIQNGGIDPRVGNGGFYGKGTYVAVDACYPVGGRFAHRSTPDGRTVHLLVVQVCIGTPCEMGSRVDHETQNFRMPPVRVPSLPPVFYNSVKGGPHTPTKSGDGIDASVMYTIYDRHAILPKYVVQLSLPAPQ